jgi:hypothetical protein
MSLRQWNTLSERIRFQKHIELLYRLLLFKLAVGDDDEDDEDDDHMSIRSSDSDSSQSSVDTVEHVLRQTFEYGKMIYSQFEDTNIDWDSRPPLIADMSECDCINDLRFRKIHLQEVSEKFWPLMQPHLDGDYDRIRLQNQYTLPFETCFMILLYHLAEPRRLQPDMERFFAIRKSKISAALNTIVDALYEVALPYLSNPALFQHRFHLYSKLIFDKCNAANMMWGFIDGILRKVCRPTRFQRAAYIGHKRTHGVKFQSVVTPDGLIACLFPQQISNNKHSKVTSITLEVRVPAEHERVYLEILDRLNERASQLKDGEVNLVLDERIGTLFFPYYAKAERPKLFEKLMKKQNAMMASVSVIPIFGYTQNAMNQLVKCGSDESTLHSAMRSHPNILKIEQTASSATLGKYLVIFERYMRDEVEIHMDELFEQLPDLPDQPMNFVKPQRGGNTFKKARVNNISTFLSRIEQKIDDENISYADDDEASTPPPRPRRFTISYAQATKRLSFNKETILSPPTNSVHATTTAATYA